MVGKIKRFHVKYQDVQGTWVRDKRLSFVVKVRKVIRSYCFLGQLSRFFTLVGNFADTLIMTNLGNSMIITKPGSDINLTV